VPFWLYFGASMLFGGAYAVALNVLGESLFRHQGVRSILLVAAVVVAALGVWWWRKRGRGSATDE
jgi:protein-S-isoprenylcysteine O-methyltransferase Ste14